MAEVRLNRRGEGSASQPRGELIEEASKAVGAVVSAASFATLAPVLGWFSVRAISWRSGRNRLSSSLLQPDGLQPRLQAPILRGSMRGHTLISPSTGCHGESMLCSPLPGEHQPHPTAPSNGDRGIYLTPPTPRCSVCGHQRGFSANVAGVGAAL